MISSDESISEKIKDFKRILLLFESSNTGLWEMSKDGDVNFFNKSFYKNFDVDLENSHLSQWTSLMHPADLKQFTANVETQVTGNIDMFKSEYRVKKRDGKYYWIEARGVGKYDEDKNLRYMVGSHIDITERKEYENNIFKLAYHDRLTGLYNRSKLMDLLKIKISDDKSGSFIYMKLNNFRLFNDTYGQKFGDEVLRNIAENMNRIFSDDCDLFRLNASEFAVLCHKENSRTNLKKIIADLHKSIVDKLSLKGKALEAQLSAGICEFPTEMESADDLIHQTMLTMRYARNNLDGNCAFYDEDIQKSVQRELDIETGLLQALDNDEMYLNYQPIVNAKTGKTASFEALLRWKSKKWGKIYPDQFIPVAEKTQDIIEIGLFVIRSACKFIKKYERETGKTANISVNVSVIQLVQVDFADQVMTIIHEESVEPHMLTIEITESLMLDTNQSSTKHLRTLKEAGVGIALDDFGTGYSSLNNLFSIPLTKMKIDRKVMLKAMVSETINEFVSSITTLCRQKGLEVIAEGIENEDMAFKAKSIGVDFLQGYLYSRPIPENEIFELVD